MSQLIVTFTCNNVIHVYTENSCMKPVYPYKRHSSINDAIKYILDDKNIINLEISRRKEGKEINGFQIISDNASEIIAVNLGEISQTDKEQEYILADYPMISSSTFRSLAICSLSIIN